MITLVLGGARSGKSEAGERIAERIARHSAEPELVTYIATGRTADDADMAARVELHQRRRPLSWMTVEAGPDDLPHLLASARGTVLLDSLGTWLASSETLAPDVDGLCGALTARRDATVVVSEEVGLGVHPSSEVGRRFRDALGVLNQRVAEIADDVLLVVAGRVLRLEEL